MQSTVVIVEDEEHLREAVAEYLGAHGLRALHVPDGRALRALLRDESPDVVVLDVAMPGEDGFAIGRWLRSLGPRPGIIFATAAASARHRIGGLELGADDYLVKPYELRELLARITRILARLPPGQGQAVAEPGQRRTITAADLVINLAARTAARRDGTSVRLSASEFDLLLAFANRPNRLLTRQQLAELVSERGRVEAGRAMDIRIARLRSRLAAASVDPGLIRTVRGEGYMFAAGE